MITTLNYKNLSASIKSKGAELVQLTKGETNYLWEVDNQFWNKTSPVLFPIVGRLKNDCYIFENKKYSMNRHGFARDYDFQIVSQSENSVVFSLIENETTLKIYPFTFELQLSYTLSENGLTVGYTVTNNDTKKMFFNIGAHPAFAIRENLSNYSLLFEEDGLEKSTLHNDLFTSKVETIPLKNKELALDYTLFQNDAIVLKSAKTRKLVLKNKEETVLSFIYEDFPILGIWTKQNAPFLCLEPWNGNADLASVTGNIEEKENVLWVAPSETFTCEFKIEV